MERLVGDVPKSPGMERLITLIVESPALERTIGQVIDSRPLDQVVARLLESAFDADLSGRARRRPRRPHRHRVGLPRPGPGGARRVPGGASTRAGRRLILSTIA
jgi:hypothetical protein